MDIGKALALGAKNCRDTAGAAAASNELPGGQWNACNQSDLPGLTFEPPHPGQLTDSVALPSPIEEEPDEHASGLGLSLREAPAAASLAVASPSALPASGAARDPGFRLGLPPSPRDDAPEPRPFTPRPYWPPEPARRSGDPNPAVKPAAAAVQAGGGGAAAAGGGAEATSGAAEGARAAAAGPPAAVGWQIPGAAGLFRALGAGGGAGAGGGGAAEGGCREAQGDVSPRSVSSVEVRLY